MEGKKDFFFQAGFCVFAAVPLPGLAKQEALFLFRSLRDVCVRALCAVAELLQPCSRRSSFCLHRVLPTIAAAGSCLKRQQRETAIVESVMIMQMPVPWVREAIA